MGATSFDIVDTANVLRFRDVVNEVVLPELLNLERTLINITLREAGTLQIGRTHGQHAVPITFGFATAEYVNRLGDCILKINEAAKELRGKFSGAVGAYNASSLIVDRPEMFEQDVLGELGLNAALHSTQIVPPEPMSRLMNELLLASGVMANLARDMRNLQRTEIGEVGEKFEDEQIGSSTMPQKRNPVSFENVESLWKILVGRIVTVFLDQISEHQRDLTNSASQRTYGEIICYVVAMAKRLAGAMSKLEIDRDNLKRNFESQQDFVIAEPLYIVLAALGHPSAHEKVRQLALEARKTGRTLKEIALADPEIEEVYLPKMTPRHRDALSDIYFYTGVSANKALSVAAKWGMSFFFDKEK